MKTIKTDIGHGPELHKLYFEYLQDVNAPRFPNPDYWFYQFRDPTFFCLLMTHGKRKCGFVLGRIYPFYEKPVCEIEVFFLKRGFRQMKFKRGLCVALQRHLIENKVEGALFMKPKHQNKERKLCLV